MSKKYELDLDHRFWNKISVDADFQKWFLSHTKFAGRDMTLVTNELWHQTWYKDPESGVDSETDILLIFVERKSGTRCAVHIENKPIHGAWEPDQASKYRKRALNRMKKKNYVDFQVAIIAPSAFLATWPIEAAQFDFQIPYEEICRFVPEFCY